MEGVALMESVHDNRIPNPEVSMYLMNDEEVHQFDQLFSELIQFNKTLYYKFSFNSHAVAILRDIWCMFYKPNYLEFILAPNKNKYPLRMIYINLLKKFDLFKEMQKHSSGDAKIALLYAVIYIEHMSKWVLTKANTKDLLRYNLKVVVDFYKQSEVHIQNILQRNFAIPRQVALSEFRLARGIHFLSITKYSELRYEFALFKHTVHKLSLVVSCRNHLTNKRMLLTTYLSDLFSIFYARNPHFLSHPII